MTDVEIAQRTREFSGFAPSYINDRDGYRTVKKTTFAILSREAFLKNQLWVASPDSRSGSKLKASPSDRTRLLSIAPGLGHDRECQVAITRIFHQLPPQARIQFFAAWREQINPVRAHLGGRLLDSANQCRGNSSAAIPRIDIDAGEPGRQMRMRDGLVHQRCQAEQAVVPERDERGRQIRFLQRRGQPLDISLDSVGRIQIAEIPQAAMWPVAAGKTGGRRDIRAAQPASLVVFEKRRKGWASWKSRSGCCAVRCVRPTRTAPPHATDAA